MQKFAPVISLILCLVSFTYAQSAAQYAVKIPACVETCDSAAIAAVGCASTDYACHCAHGTQIKPLVLPCLETSSNCTVAELQLFGTLVVEICGALNSTGTASATTGVANSTVASATASSSLLAYTGGAVVGKGLGAGIVGLLGAAVVGFM